MGKWMNAKKSSSTPYDIPTADKRKFWREIGEIVRNGESRDQNEANMDCSTPSITARNILDRCVIVKVHDDKSNYYYKESGGHMKVISKEKAKSLLSRDLDCKLLCEYIQTRFQGNDDWRLRLVIFLDDIQAPSPRYFVDFTEFSNHRSPRDIREVSAKVDIHVDTGGPFALRWDLTITRENGRNLFCRQK
ncbi:hypothetical protein CAPTEDRAFT_195122 [Capitella teleta]|uniref:Uncharacterized protein n=1 Tax=Capitella teleta TaxID=283909 RepID=R7VJY8_CAPTE|nr:hypothetical protein CAPTEDRAFT_195122 [Capitella teleta]|eukprot:ELU16891.1 hypothetical protein CAPTEDRAFT_195122 [Capitella teleta]